MDDLNRMTTNQLKTYIQNKGKRANTRLVSLEKEGYESLPAYNYVASKLPNRNKYTESSKRGNLKFTLSSKKLLSNIDPQNKRNVLLEQATNIQNFLKAKTSTVGGVKKVYEKSYLKFKENFDISMDDYKLFFKKGGFDKFDTKYISSDRIIQTGKKYGIEVLLKLQSEDIYNIKTVKEFDKKAKEIKKQLK